MCMHTTRNKICTHIRMNYVQVWNVCIICTHNINITYMRIHNLYVHHACAICVRASRACMSWSHAYIHNKCNPYNIYVCILFICILFFIFRIIYLSSNAFLKLIWWWVNRRYGQYRIIRKFRIASNYFFICSRNDMITSHDSY